jgi:RND family efflux transporter MFP subunit
MAIILAGLFAAAGCSGNNPKGGPQGGPGARAVSVQVRTAKVQPVGEFTEYLATLISRDSAVLQPDVEGQITRIFVHSGQTVKAAEPILQINPVKQQATVHSQQANEQARRAAAQFAKQDLERKQQLFHEGIIARQDLDLAQTAYDAAQADVSALQAGVREQQAQLQYYTVRAPKAGIVGDIPVHVGDRVVAQTQLTTIVGPGPLEAYIYIPAEKASEAKPGMKVTIVADDNQPPVQSIITFISPHIDSQSQLLLIKAEVSNSIQRFRHDEEVHARVYWKQMNAPTIPVTAVIRLGSQAFAFVVELEGGKDIAHQRPIQLGQVMGNEYVVLDGIKAGDRVVVSGTQMLGDGVPVSATEAAGP